MIVTPTNIHKSLALACWRSPKEAKTQIEIIECTSTSIKLYMVFQVPSHTVLFKICKNKSEVCFSNHTSCEDRCMVGDPVVRSKGTKQKDMWHHNIIGRTWISITIDISIVGANCHYVFKNVEHF